MSRSSGGGSSAPVFQTFGGSYGDTDYSSSKRLSKQAEGMIGSKSAFSTPLENALLNPQYGAKSPHETALINSLLDATAGRTATRGLGAPTENSMASAIAPTLQSMYQQNVQNLMGADTNFNQGKQLDLQALMEMIGYSMPQVMGGNVSTESSRSSGLFCWVAREVYGETNPKWYLFRDWMLTKAPYWFVKLYMKHGIRVARFISNKPKIKSAIRFWMDGRIGVTV